jgi:hypothetical protein
MVIHGWMANEIDRDSMIVVEGRLKGQNDGDTIGSISQSAQTARPPGPDLGCHEIENLRV